MEECQRLSNILGQYEIASSQTINCQKTYPFFSKNIKLKVKGAIQKLLGAQIMTEYETYLGLPMASGKLKGNTFKDLQEKISECWGGKRNLSQKQGMKT